MLVLKEREKEHLTRNHEWEEEKKELNSDLIKCRQTISHLQEKIAVLGSNIENLHEEIIEKNNEISTLEQNMNASTLQCSALQVHILILVYHHWSII